MGQGYRQLSLDERIEIARLWASGWSWRRIGAAIGRSHTTVSREVRRNSRMTRMWSGGYAPVRAQELAQRRRRWDCRFKLVRQPDLRDRVRQSLAMGMMRSDRLPIRKHAGGMFDASSARADRRPTGARGWSHRHQS
ncbi:helix-turn-helix domain-containing protein [Sphingomonas sp. 1P08PE]|uniref:helix-turn-helix domain-containing protein n=1 Tax=Sphingomonas sp. 1P08PE TaxID=554122 RepID=UPI0039A3A5C6